MYMLFLQNSLILFAFPNLFRYLALSRYASQIDWAKWRIFVANESITKLTSPESNYSLLDKHLLSFGTVLVPEMCVHTIDPLIEGPPSSFAAEYAQQISREFQHTPDRVSEGIPQFDVLMLGLDPAGKAAGLAASLTLLVLMILFTLLVLVILFTLLVLVILFTLLVLMILFRASCLRTSNVFQFI
jgi:hypothetical protein